MLQGKSVAGGVCLFPHLGIQLPHVEVGPLGDLCWSVLWSKGIGVRFRSGGCATWQPAPHLAGDHEMSLQVQPEPESLLICKASEDPMHSLLLSSEGENAKGGV